VLRQDNADLRLSELGFQVGLLSEDRYGQFSEKRMAIDAELARVHATRVNGVTLAELLRRPEITYNDLPETNGPVVPAVIAEQVQILLKYEGYIARQEAEIQKFKTIEERKIPAWIDYASIHSLRSEARQKLTALRPSTLGQASRISGVSPSDISVLAVWMKRAPTTQEAPAKE
jgi:tRNA uridine 5-carboxymethylaminomethyl modification enzyme